MNFIRTSWLGRERPQDGSELEQQRPADVQEQTRNNLRSFAISRPAISSLFSGRPSWATRERRLSESESGDDDGPKSPAPDRFRFPHLTRPRTQDIPNQTPTEDEMVNSEVSSQPSRVRTRMQRFSILARPPAARTSGGESERRRSRFGGSQLAELHLADLAGDGRRQRTRRVRDNSGSSRRRQHKEPPTKFLFCFPWVKSRRARALILRCFVSGLFLITMLTIYLSLSITKNINTSEFSILLILLIILTTIIFCHGLVLLCMILVRPRNRQGTSGNDLEGNRYGHPGYAIPRQPIRVVLARDEEAAGIESSAAKLKPPAYGLWRESVRVDPDRIYWQRAKSPPPDDADNEEANRHPALRRPPSYASDDGIEYVVDARPRSIAPPRSSIYSQPSTLDSPMTSSMTDVPPLPHPPATELSGPRVVGRPGNWSIV
ncbi:hypothetical protein EKO27_g7751 [Xylaria grammica]|uniref:Uncharacterized protein n=1 Tax=Xylaria grammica TaxID=363999 RepID=A0A439CYQ1_9PEZI|nr:hypothetical protein EKO27_g7751 [Xylaria grammica]